MIGPSRSLPRNRRAPVDRGYELGLTGRRTRPRGLPRRWSVTEAARFVAERGVIRESVPILLKFVTQVATRFGVVVTQKITAQALPIVGALGGAAVNYAFIEHFQDVARGSFHGAADHGKERIRTAYDLGTSGAVRRLRHAVAEPAIHHVSAAEDNGRLIGKLNFV
jgi:hypothetical protein